MINNDTGISIGVLVATFPMVTASVVLWLKMHRVEKKLKTLWTVPNQKVFCERLQHNNPRINVPDVGEVLDTFKSNGTREETT